MNYYFTKAMQLQLWPDKDMPEISCISEEELRRETEQEKQNFLALQLYLPGFEPEESN